MKTNLKLKISFLVIIVFITSQACKKIVEVDLPVDKITNETAYGSVNTAVASINSVYAELASTSVFQISTGLGMAADEVKPLFTNPDYQNNFAIQDSQFSSIWNNFYQLDIYRLNSFIEGVTASVGITESSKKILVAEAKFTRAFLYFYLVNLYGDVPLVLTTDFKTNSTISRSPVESVYQQIILDLKEANAALPEHYLNPDLTTITTDRVRPTKMAASALLARVYLFHKDWSLAEIEATKVIADTKFVLTDINAVFKKNSAETIWSLQPNFAQVNGQSNNAVEGNVIPRTGTTPFYQISEFLYNSFEQGDSRKFDWIGISNVEGRDYYYAYKYKMGQNRTQDIQPQEEYSVVLRLAEQYLIRAESKAQQNKILGPGNAQEDLDFIRNRAGLNGIAANTKLDVLKSIWHERQVELFTEWGGFRWLDLKRTGQIDNVMQIVAPQKGGTWSPNKALLPIPYFEFLTNSALRGHQNPGYRERI